MAGELPSAVEFARGFYTDNGEPIDPKDPGVAQFIKASIVREDGALHLRLLVAPGDPADTAARTGCEQYVNGFVDANKDLAERLGSLGLFKLAFACTAETLGKAPVGFTQRVLNELAVIHSVRWWQKPSVWLSFAVGGGAALFWLRRQEPA